MSRNPRYPLRLQVPPVALHRGPHRRGGEVAEEVPLAPPRDFSSLFWSGSWCICVYLQLTRAFLTLYIEYSQSSVYMFFFTLYSVGKEVCQLE